MNNSSKYGTFQKPYTFQAGIPSNLRDSSKASASFNAPPVQEEGTLPITPEVQHKTNLNGGAGVPEPDAGPAESNTDPSMGDFILTAISWHNIALSTILFLGGIFVALGVDYLLQGKHGLPLLSDKVTWWQTKLAFQFNGVAYILLASVAINFVRSVVSVKWQTKCAWVNSATVKSIASQADSFVMEAAALHDKYLSARDPALTLKVTLFLWALVYLGYTLSIWRLACLAYFSAFILGAIRTFFASELSRIYDSTTSSLQEHQKGLGLKRGHGAIVLFILVVGLAFISTWTTRALIVLLGLMVVRCNLKPNEVDIIANRATDTCGPYVNSARKQAKRLSMAAQDFVRRSSQGSGAKTHWK